MAASPAVLLSYLYFLQGLPYGLQARFLPIYFRAHGMSLSNIGFIKALFIPWMCKTLWAPFVDRHGNKKKWLLWSMLGLGITCVAAAGIQPNWFFCLCAILLIFNLLTSTQDIATDGLAIEILTSSQVASGNIAQVVGYKFGAIIGGGILAWLSDYISWSSIFIFLTLIYAMAVGVVKLYVPEGGCHSSSELTVEIPDSSDSKHQVREKSRKGHVDETQFDDNNSNHLQSPSANTKNKTRQAKDKYRSTLHKSNNLPGVDRDGLTHDKDDFTHGLNEDDSCELLHPVELNQGPVVNERYSRGMWWITDHFATVLSAEGTVWILIYVLVYKLGEQGALNMMPLFLIDHGMPPADVGLWTGIVGQAVSIAGSVIGGAAISSDRYTPLGFLWRLSVLKVVVLAAETLVITSTWSDKVGSLLEIRTVPCVALMLVLLLVSGAVSTTAFTLMMHCSQRADSHCRASHYSLLATAEVLGKLVFSIFVGAITDAIGYSKAFGLFLILSVIVLPLFRYAPLPVKGDSQCTGKNTNKNC